MWVGMYTYSVVTPQSLALNLADWSGAGVTEVFIELRLVDSIRVGEICVQRLKVRGNEVGVGEGLGVVNGGGAG